MLRLSIWIAPYAVWMALMAALPHAAWAYAVRTAVAAAALGWAYFAAKRLPERPKLDLGWGAAGWAVAGALAVAAVWILPDGLEFYRRFLVWPVGSLPDASAPSGAIYAPANCSWPLAIARLAGSAFVIAPAEELMFRSFAYRWISNRRWYEVSHRVFDPQAFFIAAALFACEHDRFAAAFAAGIVYGALYVRHGFASAAVSHALTNFILGVYVLASGEWGFW